MSFMEELIDAVDNAGASDIIVVCSPCEYLRVFSDRRRAYEAGQEHCSHTCRPQWLSPVALP